MAAVKYILLHFYLYHVSKHIVSFQSDKQNELVDVESCNDLPDDQPSTLPAVPTTIDFDPHDDNDDPAFSSSKLESSAAQVKHKFAQGCECTESNCFAGLNEEAVFRHRLNVAELTREEHDMYLMGVTMACLGASSQTHRNKERQRQRATYMHKGKRVCLDAFHYLENVTQYHLKRIRHHVMTQGVVPRVHGNIGKKPHNTFSLDMYKSAEHFIKQTIADHQTGSGGNAAVFVSTETRSSIYDKFRQSTIHPAGSKVMGYTTFRHFIKKQFPQVRFASAVASPQQPSTKRRTPRKKGGTVRAASGTSKAVPMERAKGSGASRNLKYCVRAEPMERPCE